MASTVTYLGDFNESESEEKASTVTYLEDFNKPESYEKASTVTYLGDFNEPESEEKFVIKPKRKRQQNRIWLKGEEFDSAEEAEKNVDLMKIWKKSSSKKTLEGSKVEYRCIGGKYRNNECPAGLYLLYHATSAKVSLFTTECDHDNHNTEPTRGLDNELKNFIKQKYEEGIQKPNAILAVLRRNNMTEPQKPKLLNYLKQLRQEKYGVSTISGTEITDWCKQRETVPVSKDEPFVLKYVVRCESFNPDEQDLKIVISTARLLENLKKTQMIQFDATYKVIWQGYPLVIAGTSDKDQVFHPLAIAVCKGESADDFAFIFEALHNFDSQWEPQLLLADASDAITNGFIRIFGVPRVRVMCFFHVMKNVEKYLKKLTKKEDVKSDICALQTCKDEHTFVNASKLFVEKWNNVEDQQVKEFMDYFHSQWLIKNPNWYEGIALGYPSTNNGLEATNAVIKGSHTLRERLPVAQFLNNILELLITWSKDRNPQLLNCKIFHEVPTTSLEQWTCAYQWAMRNKEVLQENDIEEECKIFYTCSESTEKSITSEYLSTYKEKEGNWESFDEFKKIHYSIWVITINFKDLSRSTCTCPYFLKHSNCKHSLGMKILLNLVETPTEVKVIPLREKRKRGRPARAQRALIIQ